MSEYELLLALAGWLATTWLAYRWGLRSQRLHREEESRQAIKATRTEYIGFMRGWIYSFSKKIYKAGGWERDYDAFFTDIPSFISLTEHIQTDLPPKIAEDFGTLTTTILKTSHQDFYRERFDDLVSRCERLIEIVKNA
jgi:hypothetical protein